MGLMRSLVEIYDVLMENNNINTPNIISHSDQNAHIEILLDAEGNMINAITIPKDDASTLIPVTINSASRTSKPESHPLFDKLQYISENLIDHLDQANMTDRKIKDIKESSEAYQILFNEWISYIKDNRDRELGYVPDEALKRLIPVRSYLSNNDIIQDLADRGIVILDEMKCINDKPKEKNDLLKLVSSQQDALVRFRVHTGADEDRINYNSDVQKSYISFYEQKLTDVNICMITGKLQKTTPKHPKRIRHPGDGSKLISANDTENFTFKGRFIDAEDALSIGYYTSEKAHNALKWLIQNQGTREGETIFLSFETKNKVVPDPFHSLLGEDGDNGGEDITDKIFAAKLQRAILGYSEDLDPSSTIVAMILDSATPGRLSIVFYRELLGSEFLKNIKQWNEKTSWELLIRDDKLDKSYMYFTIPSPVEISKACYGSRISDKLLKSTIERLYKCIIDGDSIPRDLLETIKHRVSNPSGISEYEWEKILRISCAMYRNYYDLREKEVYDLSLDKDLIDRSYLYGRLLAVADWIEQSILRKENQKRATNALRYMNAFSNHPYKTWTIIKNAILPYEIRQIEYRDYYDNIMEEIMSRFSEGDFANDKPLSGKYILGYYHQRGFLRNELKDRIEAKK